MKSEPSPNGQDSTTEISDMLSQLGHATDSVVTIVRQTENTTLKGMERAQNAANLLEQITSQFENINAMTSEIATATATKCFLLRNKRQYA